MKIIKNLFILIAEDDEDDSTFILESFKKHPLFSKVEVLKNGKEVLNYLNDDSKRKPDLILTDLNMPVMNGLELLKEIFNHHEFKQICTFAYSTSCSLIYQKKCVDLGAIAFLQKPSDIINFNTIPQKIITLLSKTA